MVRARKVNSIGVETAMAFGAYAQAEWELLLQHRNYLYENSKRLWTLYVEDEPVCVIGLKQNTLLGAGAEIFFMLCRKFQAHVRELSRFIRRALRRMVKLFGSISVKIEGDYWIGEKFVRFFGFRNQGRVCYTQNTSYNLYELRASWL